MKKNGSARTGAFTLVEALIAIGLLGLVVAAIYSSWMAILRASRAAQEVSAVTQRERVAIQVIEQALNGTCMFPANGRWYAFVAENGMDASLSFVSHLPKSFPRGGRFGEFDVRRVTFSLEPGPGGQRQLVLRQNPLLMELDQDESEHPLVLAPNVKELLFSFWDANKGEWVDEWNNTNQIPKIVMVSLVVGRAGSDPAAQGYKRQLVRVVNVPSGGMQAALQSMPLPPGVPPGATNLPPGLRPGGPVPARPGFQVRPQS